MTHKRLALHATFEIRAAVLQKAIAAESKQNEWTNLKATCFCCATAVIGPVSGGRPKKKHATDKRNYTAVTKIHAKIESAAVFKPIQYISRKTSCIAQHALSHTVNGRCSHRVIDTVPETSKKNANPIDRKMLPNSHRTAPLIQPTIGRPAHTKTIDSNEKSTRVLRNSVNLNRGHACLSIFRWLWQFACKNGPPLRSSSARTHCTQTTIKCPRFNA